ncbi:hypothetical protein RJ640_026999 [Escallonia rubra]|uniref:KOW domain-containing protein n=1 Tax=Escallonia rubra TaxID=112253 RepID=A0AA88RVG6_9ASTE|nr:hypothetical protein RJ640_026999 [Escallonia rubra]
MDFCFLEIFVEMNIHIQHTGPEALVDVRLRRTRQREERRVQMLCGVGETEERRTAPNSEVGIVVVTTGRVRKGNVVATAWFRYDGGRRMWVGWWAVGKRGCHFCFNALFAAASGRNRGRRGGHDALIGTTIKIWKGPFKGYKGRVVDVKGQTVRVEMDASMKILTGKFYRLSRPFYVHVDREHLSDNVNVSTPYRHSSRYGSGSETPMHPSRTRLHPYMTPMRDPGATPIHDGMRTPMRDRAWNPYTPIIPPRDPWEDANPASWGSSPQYQPGSPPSRTYDAPTPGGNFSEAGTPRDSSPVYVNAPSPYLPSTPGRQPPMTPSSAYLPNTPGGQPMTPGSGGLDIMSPVVESTFSLCTAAFLNDFYDVLWSRMAGNGETVTSLPNEIEIVVPWKSDKIKIMGGAQRGATGKLIRVDGIDGIVKVDDTLYVKILDMVILAKLAQP